jgi:predicted Co/Zn/Cd cation transporter (cation efflux family)
MNLNPAHLHLILNHIPILGTMIFAPLVLVWGLVRHSRDVTQTGLFLAINLAVTTIPIYLTGEPAEEQLERQPWFSKTLAEPHEERAEGGLVAVLLTGAGAMVALWRGRRGRPSASTSRVRS